MASREDNIYFAKLAEQAERYEDMVRRMKAVVDVSPHKSNRLDKNSTMRNETCSLQLIKTLWELDEPHGDQLMLSNKRKKSEILDTTKL